ncbi:MAG: hypothetical protein FWG66_05120 [Spirochaetes bacterium]|nr:hypothetical protein [Spirochaetota bacterium]
MINLSVTQKQYIGLQFIIDLCSPKSAYGKEALQNLQPFTPEQEGELQRQLDNIEKTLAHRPLMQTEYRRLEQAFEGVKNLQKSMQKCREGVLGEIDLFEIKSYLLQLKEIAPLFDTINSRAGYAGIVFLDASPALLLLDPEQSGVATFHISGRYSKRLEGIRREKKSVEEQMQKFPFEEIPAQLLDARQALAFQEEREEQSVRASLSGKLRPFIPELLANAAAIGDLDLTMQKAAVAARFNAGKPLVSKDCVSFTDMINPQVAEALRGQNKAFTAISVELRKGATVVTGANMGGKSIALVTTALNIALVHYGFYPAAASAALPLFDFMHIISDNADPAQAARAAHGLSSFGGEVLGINAIVADIERGFTCAFIDEIARGTNPQEGAAIAQGVTAYLNESRAISMISTHYDKVARHAGAHYQIIGLKQLDFEALKKQAGNTRGGAGELAKRAAACMDYNLVLADKTQAPPQEALNVCHLLGMPPAVLAEIEKIYETTANA